MADEGKQKGGVELPNNPKMAFDHLTVAHVHAAIENAASKPVDALAKFMTVAHLSEALGSGAQATNNQPSSENQNPPPASDSPTQSSDTDKK
jgi:hypothetical protein